MSDTSVRRRNRYVAEVMALHDRISLRDLASHIDPDSLLYRVRRPDGLVVLAARTEGIPERYLLAIYGFRLAQYLRIGYASDEVAYRTALFAEPWSAATPEVHLLALKEADGSIVRYLSMVGSGDPEPRDPRDPDRAPFPCEVAHRVNLFDHVPIGASVRTDQIWEIKRLVDGRQLAGATVRARLRVTLELTLAFYLALGRIDPPVAVLVGDGEEGVAITRMLRSLREVTVLEGTEPSLPADNLMAPLYTARDVVKAFVAVAPAADQRHQLIASIERALAGPSPLAGFKRLVTEVGGELRRVHT